MGLIIFFGNGSIPFRKFDDLVLLALAAFIGEFRAKDLDFVLCFEIRVIKLLMNTFNLSVEKDFLDVVLKELLSDQHRVSCEVFSNFIDVL